MLESFKTTKKTSVSVVIPTLNRPSHLEKTLHSLLAQERLPNEVIIVDQSDNCETEYLITEARPMFSTKAIALRYVREEVKSITHARNVGVRIAKGDIVFFFDDDIVPHSNYISETLRVYCDHPNAVGVQGTFANELRERQCLARGSIILNYLCKAFLVTHFEKDTQKILPSGNMIGAHPLTKTIEAEIILPAISSFRREKIQNLNFDENLKGYSWQEEYFTINLNRRYPRSLYVTPFAKAIHDQAPAARPTDKQFYYISTSYELYNFIKKINPTFRNWVAFYWKSWGRIVITLLGFHRNENRTRLFYLLRSYLLVVRHFGHIKNGILDPV